MSAPLPPSHAPHLFPVVANEMQIGGIPITRLAERVGRTPFYAYDRGMITRRVAELRSALPAGNPSCITRSRPIPMPALVRHMAQPGGWLRSWPRPVKCGLRSILTCLPTRISFAGPGKVRSRTASQAASCGNCCQPGIRAGNGAPGADCNGVAGLQPQSGCCG
jgi:diaminopimelate decarboxylase